MTITADDASTLERAPPDHKFRAFSFAVAVLAAIGVGLACKAGAAGSIIALPLGFILLLLLRQCRRHGVALWRTGLLPAALISWLAVAISPGPLALALHGLCLTSLALAGSSLRLRHAADAMALTGLFASVRATPATLFGDVREVLSPNRGARRASGLLSFANLALPALTFALFATLLAIANPMMESLVIGRFADVLSGWVVPASLAALLLLSVIAAARPSSWMPIWDRDLPDTHWRSIFLNPISLMTTLVLLNGLFLVQNIFDFRYVWLDGALPPDLTHAEYVHRGSYSLIATAMLAALLIVFALRPGSATAASRPVRLLVYLWIAQNVFLVASSAERTLAYVEDYGMSMWRLSGLIWMGIVAIGLVLVAIRIAARRGNEWLTNANLLICLVVLLSCSLVDLRWVVADWNASRAIADRSSALDTGYLAGLGPSAVPAFIRLQHAGITVNLRCDPNTLFSATPLPEIATPLAAQQQDWQSVRLRDAYYQMKLQEFAASCRDRGNR